jgi:hypothetical protein
VWIAKGALATLLQKIVGDALVATSRFESLTLEFKFLENSRDAPFEAWSNRVLMFDGTVDRYRSTPGWGTTCRADLIGIYNIAADRGVVGKLPAWREMLIERLPSGLRRWQLYDQREQIKRSQLNATHVVWTPYGELVRHAGFVAFSAQQLDLFEGGNPIKEATA